MPDCECVDFLQWALPQMGFRWLGFRKVRGQVCKRITRRRAELGLPTLAAYRQYLGSEPGEWKVLDGLCRITISRFGRDRAVFERLATEILPRLLDGQRAGDPETVRIWSAGCGAGEEPYSLAVLAGRQGTTGRPGAELAIVATDADEHQIDRASTAIYPASSLRELSSEIRDRAFSKVGSDAFQLRATWRMGIEFSVQDLRWNMPEGPFDLILCRNLVFTYFDIELQSRILRALIGRLTAGGYLVIGSHEELPEQLADLPAIRGCSCILGPLVLCNNERRHDG